MLSNFEKIIVLLFALGTVYVVTENTGHRASQPSVEQAVEPAESYRLASRL